MNTENVKVFFQVSVSQMVVIIFKPIVLVQFEKKKIFEIKNKVN